MENGPEFKIRVSILKDVATVMIRPGLTSLNVVIIPKRVRRLLLSKENMAAAIYNSASIYPEPLIDPTCGFGDFLY